MQPMVVILILQAMLVIQKNLIKRSSRGITLSTTNMLLEKPIV